MDHELQQHWNKINQQRAAFYGWFAGAFAKELSNQAFEFYSDGNADALLQALAQLGFEREVAHLQEFTAALKGTEDERINLMADFASCFLLDSRQSALPYASYYLEESKLLYGDANTRMREFLEGNQLQLHEDFREPADHLVVYLAVMADWCAEVANLSEPVEIQRQIAAQHEFLTEGLLPWLVDWAKRLDSVPNLGFTFYPAMGQLLLSYVTADADAMLDGQDDSSAAKAVKAVDRTSADGNHTLH